jgi:surface polysaccharide O-acyltransferase-like enzyme
LHTSARTIYLDGQVGPWSWGIANLVNSSTRWCVPVFVMISGALVAQRPIADSTLFIKKRTATIGIPIIFWTVAYLLWRQFYRNEDMSYFIVAKYLFTGESYYHTYFLFLILGLYIFTPAIAAALSVLSRKQALILSSIALACASVTMTVQGLRPNALTYFVPYIGYFCLGAILINIKVPARIPALVVTTGIIATQVLTTAAVKNLGVKNEYGLYFYNYFSINVIAVSIAVFCLFKELRIPDEWGRIITKIAPLTLGIYLLHPVILELLRAFYSRQIPQLLWPILDVPVTFAVAVLISAAAAATMRRVPYLGRVV